MFISGLLKNLTDVLISVQIKNFPVAKEWHRISGPIMIRTSLRQNLTTQVKSRLKTNSIKKAKGKAKAHTLKTRDSFTGGLSR